MRPNSIHTINSGMPQELGTGGYESPVDNRHSYPSAANFPISQAPPPLGYQAGYPSQQPQQVPQGAPRDDRSDLPSRQRTHSFESPSSMYSTQQQDFAMQQSQQGYAQPPQAHAPYQAYQPQHQQQRVPSGSSAGGGDPGDYYR